MASLRESLHDHTGEYRFHAEYEIAREIVDAAYRIPTRLGPGLLESVYEATLGFE